MRKALLFAAGFALMVSPAFGQGSPNAGDQLSAPYNPIINPADFTHVISNKYFTRQPGMIAGYEIDTTKGITRKRIDVTGETKTVMGVTTLVVRGRGWLNGRLVQDKSDWVAQDKHGNVWYFGEAELIDHDESWEAGVDGAKPGIMMLNDPKADVTYRHEYYPGKVEDLATVIAVGIRVSLPRGPSFENCVHIREWSALNANYIKNEYSCVGVGAMVLKEHGSERIQLVTFTKGRRLPRMDHFGY